MSNETDERRTIASDTLSRMVAVIDPEWTVHEATLARAGNLSVYHLTVGTPSGRRDLVLKATPDDERHGIDTEARLLETLDAKTSIPVPEVVGSVDFHEELPAPFFLMESVAGEQIRRRNVGRLPDSAVENIARQTGRYLAELHQLGSFTDFGRIQVPSPKPASGGRPSGAAGRLTVTDLHGGSSTGEGSWTAVLERWVEEALVRHANTRFGDLTPRVRTALRDRLDALSGPFRPVIGRIDHGFHNLVVDPATGEIAGMIDWAFTLSVPSAYDFVCVEHNLTRGPWSMLPSTPDRQSLVREEVLDAYGERARRAVTDREEERALYELLAHVRAMNHIETSMSSATDEQLDRAASGYRTAVTTFL